MQIKKLLLVKFFYNECIFHGYNYKYISIAKKVNRIEKRTFDKVY